MTIYPARKHAALFCLHCCLHLSRCMVLHVTCQHGENLTCDITPRDARRKQKYHQLEQPTYLKNVGFKSGLGS